MAATTADQVTPAGTPAARPTGPEGRVALVIGNSEYETTTKLPNPVGDAKAVAQLLSQVGFEVISAANLGREDMKQVINDFSTRLAAKGPNAVALVFYAGHGLQVDGENFLVPVDAKLEKEGDVPDQSVRLFDVMKALEAVPSRMRIVILDACRNNPFSSIGDASGKGLAMVDAPAGSIVAYSTAPGTEALDGEGRHSPYAAAFMRHIKQPNLPIEQFFKRVRLVVHETTDGKQTPWESSSLTGDFAFFNGSVVTPVAEAPKPLKKVQVAELRTQAPLQAYEVAVQEDTIEYYEEFVRLYPADPLCDRIRPLLARRKQMFEWHKVVQANNKDAFRSFVERFPAIDLSAAARRLQERPRLVSLPVFQPRPRPFPNGPFQGNGQNGPFGGNGPKPNGPVIGNPNGQNGPFGGNGPKPNGPVIGNPNGQKPNGQNGPLGGNPNGNKPTGPIVGNPNGPKPTGPLTGNGQGTNGQNTNGQKPTGPIVGNPNGPKPTGPLTGNGQGTNGQNTNGQKPTGPIVGNPNGQKPTGPVVNNGQVQTGPLSGAPRPGPLGTNGTRPGQTTGGPLAGAQNGGINPNGAKPTGPVVNNGQVQTGPLSGAPRPGPVGTTRPGPLAGTSQTTGGPVVGTPNGQRPTGPIVVNPNGPRPNGPLAGNGQLTGNGRVAVIPPANQAGPAGRPIPQSAPIGNVSRPPQTPNAGRPSAPQFQQRVAPPPRPSFQAPPRPSFQAPPRPSFQAAPRPSFQAAPRPSFQAPPRASFQPAARPSFGGGGGGGGGRFRR